MLKKLKYLIMASIVILLFSSTTVIAYEDEGFKREGATLSFNDGYGYETLYINNFSEMISNHNKNTLNDYTDASFRGDFIRVDPGILLGTQLNFQTGTSIIKPPIYNKAVSCIAHDYTNSGSNKPYKITNVVDICYDKERKSVVIKTYSKDGSTVREDVAEDDVAKYIAGKLAYAIKINDVAGTGLSQNEYKDAYDNNYNHIVYGMWTPFKNAVDIYLGEAVQKGVINIKSVYSQVFDLNKYAEEHGQKTALDKFKEEYYDPEKGLDEFDKAGKSAKNFIKMEVNKNTNPKEKTQLNIEGSMYTVVGPFNIKFNEENGVNNINVYNTLIYKKDSKEIYWVEETGKNNYDDKNIWNYDWTQIKANTDFYLAIDNRLLPSNNQDYDIEFIQKLFTFIPSRIVTLESDGVQQWGAYTSYDTSEPVSGSVIYPITHKANGKITIEKVDAKNDSIKLQGVKLKLYGDLDNGNSGWVAEGVKGSKTVASYYGAATEFVTGTNRNCKH